MIQISPTEISNLDCRKIFLPPSRAPSPPGPRAVWWDNQHHCHQHCLVIIGVIGVIGAMRIMTRPSRDCWWTAAGKWSRRPSLGEGLSRRGWTLGRRTRMWKVGLSMRTWTWDETQKYNERSTCLQKLLWKCYNFVASHNSPSQRTPLPGWLLSSSIWLR